MLPTSIAGITPAWWHLPLLVAIAVVVRSLAWSNAPARVTSGANRLSGASVAIYPKADRIERRADGALAIVDYKTGAPPRAGDVELGFAPQLPLEAVIAAAGGFADVPAGEVAALEYWRLSGGQPPGEIVPLRADPDALAAAARDGLARLIARFDAPATGYPSVPRPLRAPRFSDYAHLARIKEWSLGGVAVEGPA